MKIYYDDLFLQHETGEHPECPDRLRSIVSHLRSGKFAPLLSVPADRSASDEDLLLVHTESHVKKVQEACRRGGGQLDPDTRASAHSDHIACRAIGTLMEAAEEAVTDTGEHQSLVLTRPPGHHATRNQPMGFCLFNHIAVVARHLQRTQGLENVAILDFDAHHGNGTQDIFFADPTVSYLSIHRAPPFYPGTGAIREKGDGRGVGTTLNFPIEGPPFPVDAGKLFTEEATRWIEEFRPDIVLVSAGFDGYFADPLAGLEMNVEDFEFIGRGLREVTEKVCGGRLVSVLEGGYDLSGLPLCVEAYIKGILGKEGA